MQMLVDQKKFLFYKSYLKKLNKSLQIASPVIGTGNEIKQVPVTPATKVADKNTMCREKIKTVIKHKSPQLSSTVIETGKDESLCVPVGISPIPLKPLCKPLNYFEKTISKPHKRSQMVDSQHNFSILYKS